MKQQDFAFAPGPAPLSSFLRSFLSCLPSFTANDPVSPEAVYAGLCADAAFLCKDETLSLELSGRWLFYLGPAETAEFSGESVCLPGSMDENHKGTDNTQNLSARFLNRDCTYAGPATYQREIRIPPGWAGRPIFLYLERTKKSRVWLDGQPVGTQQKSYTTPHRYDLTPYCQPDQAHTLTIEVDNSAAGMPHAMYSTLFEGEAWAHQLTEHSQTNWNGIVGRLQLTAPPPLFIDSLELRPDLASHSVRVAARLARADLREELHGILILQAESWNTDLPPHRTARQLAEFHFAAGESVVTVLARHEMGAAPLLWDEFQPCLYTLTASLYALQNGRLHQTDATGTFGMRSFTVRENGNGKQFFINGRPTFLRGEINCAVFPQTGYAPMELAAWLRILKVYKEYGLNHVRFHTWIPPHAAFEAADRLGLYLYAELPHWGRRMFGDVYEGDDADVNYYKSDTQKIFSEYLNSPSFVMFALGNEERIGFYYYEEFLKFCKALEPQLLCSDIAGHSTYPPSADFAAKFSDPGYLPRLNDHNDWDYSDMVHAAPVAITGHEVGQLQVYPHYEQELPAYETAVLKPRNLEHFQTVLAQAGLAGRAADFSRSTGKLAAMLYRHFVESYLRTPGAGGFTLLGLQDFTGQGTALVGLLDAFFQSKGAVTPQVFRQSCCELTVLARLPRFVWAGDEAFAARILVSNYTADAITCSVNWRLEDSHNRPLASGRFPNVLLPQGQVTVCGLARAQLPCICDACQMRLKLWLEGNYHAPFAPGSNEYPLWLFPAQPDLRPPDGVVLCRSYDFAAQQALAAGKSVLIVSAGTAAALPHSRAVSFRPDFWSPMFHTGDSDGYSLGICVEKAHPLFAAFPTDVFGDWQWYGPLQNARGLLINDFPPELIPLVQPIATIDLPERLAMLFEARVRTGRLFVCTIDLLQKQDIASRHLLAALYAYVAGTAFAPRVELNEALVRAALPPLDLLGVRLKTSSALQVGETAPLALEYLDSHGSCPAPEKVRTVFHSSDSSVMVDGHGNLYGIRPGISMVSATVFHGAGFFSARQAVKVGETTALPLSLEQAVLRASSSHPEHPAAHMLCGERSTFWQSNYPDRTQRMPQWVVLELPQEATVNALLCGAWRGHSRGAILRAAVSVSRDGVRFDRVCRQSWAEDTISEDRLFCFAPRSVRQIRLEVEWAVMHTGDSNAVSISRLALYNSELIARVQSLPPSEVRFGTPLERVLADPRLPARLSVTLPDGRTDEAQVVWSCDRYFPDLPADYCLTGTLFKEGIANPGRIHARQIIRLLPKNMTAPPDKTALDALLKKAHAVCHQTADSQARGRLTALLTQVESFYALTGAVQHDVDVWVQRLSDALSGDEHFPTV